jgi:hypothetical protein
VRDEKLGFDIAVPLIGVTFPFDDLQLGDDIAIRRLSDGVQLARAQIDRWHPSPHEKASEAATHALVFLGWEVANLPRSRRLQLLRNRNTFRSVLDLTDAFFAALRAVTGNEIGYGQVVLIHKNWADEWRTDLPVLSTLPIRGYPDFLEARVHQLPLVEEAACREAEAIYRAFRASSLERLRIAARRLNAAYLRSHEEDSILDVCIGLETLFTYDSRSEINFRLAIRLATLCRLVPFDEMQPEQVFRLCKRIYDYRSAVVHAPSTSERKRLVKHKGTEIPAVTLGLRLLRYSLRALATHPDLANVAKLDQAILREPPGDLGSTTTASTPPQT